MSNDLSLRINDGRGRFGVALDFHLDSSMASLEAADFDADGDVQFVAVASWVRVGRALVMIPNGSDNAMVVRIDHVPLNGCESHTHRVCWPRWGDVADLDVIGANTHPGVLLVVC